MFKQIVTVLFVASLASVAVAQENAIFDVNGPGGYSITAFDRSGQRSVGGYMDTEFEFKEDANSNFKAHRFVLETSSQVSDKILVNAEIEFEYGGYVTNVDSDSTVQKGQIKIEQAWVDYKLTESLTQRTGIIVIPFGRVNILHDSDVRDATERPLYAKYIVPTTWMDTGLGFHGQFDINELEVNYQAYLINGLADTSGSNDDINSTKGIRNARPNFKQDNNGDKAVVARLGVSPKLGLDVAVSLYQGKYNDAGTNGITIIGADTFYKKGRYELVAEFASVSIDQGSSTSIPDSLFGGYVELRSHVLQKALKQYIPSLKNPVITLFTRVGMVDLDTDGDAKTYRYMAGFNFRPTESTVYKIEYRVDDKEYNDTSQSAVIASVAVGF